MSTLNNLEPQTVWRYFEEICRVPRPSKKEEKIIAWLKKFAADHSLDSKQDETGNLLITKPASPGFENKKTVVLQSHVDMVGEKNSDIEHDFETDPVVPFIDGDWVKPGELPWERMTA
jgi:dipeptidase D